MNLRYTDLTTIDEILPPVLIEWIVEQTELPQEDLYRIFQLPIRDILDQPVFVEAKPVIMLVMGAQHTRHALALEQLMAPEPSPLTGHPTAR